VRAIFVVEPAGGHGDAGGDFLEQVDFSIRQRSADGGFDSFETDRPDGDPLEGHDLVAELGEHPPDLAILAFGQGHFEDRRLTTTTDDLDVPGAHLAFGQPDPLDELVKDLASRQAGDDDAVNLLNPILRVREPVGELAVVGQEDQAGTHLVKPANRVHALGDFGQKIDHPGAARRVLVGRDVAFGLVNGEVDQAFEPDRLAVHRDLGLGGQDPGSQLAHDLSVDRDAALQDQFLTGSP
jgi:hypothetical protein